MKTPQTCPLCQQNNECAIATQTSVEQCWCMSAEFPPKSACPDIVNTEDCLCQSCVVRLSRLSPKQVD